MPNCTRKQMKFGRLGRRVIEANFEGGALSSDGGLMLLRQKKRTIHVLQNRTILKAPDKHAQSH
jgi:hypothetical protein